MTDSGSAPVPLRHRREAVIAKLCDHFALDHLHADELERLIDSAHEARSLVELDALLANLPEISEPGRVETLPENQVEESQTIVAVMGATERKGGWASARTVRVLAVMGGAVLDFREVRLPPGRTEVHVLALMGGVEIIVPPGLRVSSDGMGIMGGFEHAASGARSGDDDHAPSLRITGLALMGGVDIIERHSGESPREARRRRKREDQIRAKDRLRRLDSGNES